MTDPSPPPPAARPSGEASREARAMQAARLRRRHAADRRFRYFGLAAVAAAGLMLAALLITIVQQGWPAFLAAEVALDVQIDPASVRAPREANFQAMARRALFAMFPEVTARRDRRALGGLLSIGATDVLRDAARADPPLAGRPRRIWLPASADAQTFLKAARRGDGPVPAVQGITAQEAAWLNRLRAEGRTRLAFNTGFFTHGDSREPELAGIRGAITGSFLLLLVTVVLTMPLGVAAAVYLEELAPKNRWTDLVEININNLAAVPSIVFGLLGLAIFINVFGLPRSSALVGGIVLALMTLPTVIIAARAALRSIPPSIREAALAVGASRLQVVTHHVLPLATPGILTGAIIGMAQALGETAPLLLIGMVAFIVDVPTGITDAATALPVQVYLWAGSPERAFAAKTAAAIMVLLAFLVLMNALAVFLRYRFQRKW